MRSCMDRRMAPAALMGGAAMERHAATLPAGAAAAHMRNLSYLNRRAGCPGVSMAWHTQCGLVAHSRRGPCRAALEVEAPPPCRRLTEAAVAVAVAATAPWGEGMLSDCQTCLE